MIVKRGLFFDDANGTVVLEVMSIAESLDWSIVCFMRVDHIGLAIQHCWMLDCGSTARSPRQVTSWLSLPLLAPFRPLFGHLFSPL